VIQTSRWTEYRSTIGSREDDGFGILDSRSGFVMCAEKGEYCVEVDIDVESRLSQF
jgi:hypothetical protein